MAVVKTFDDDKEAIRVMRNMYKVVGKYGKIEL
jgi:hypothetical protein